VPEAEYATTSRLPVETIWAFVEDMDRWAPLVTGYQSHRKEGPRDSLWVLRGDVGVLSRAVTFRVRVTEWAGPERVAFALEGVNEPLSGEGAFRLERAGAAQAPPPAVAAPPRGLLARWLEPLVRWWLRAFRRRSRRGPDGEAGAGGAGATRLSFRLRIEPGGPMAPMLSALIAPALRPAAEDLAEKILAHLEAQHGVR